MFTAHVKDCRSNGPERLFLVLVVCWLGLSAIAFYPDPVHAQNQVPPKLKEGAGPDYPEEARSLMIVGDVIFRAQVDERGSVTSVQCLRVPEKNIGFEEAVQKTVSQWRFEPAQTDGNPVAGIYVGKISFSLRADEEKAIQEFVQKAAEAWNKGDAKKVASHFHKDQGRIQARQELARGSKEVQKWISSQLSADYKDLEFDVSLDHIQFFPVSDLALITPTFSLAGAGGPNEDPLRGQLSVLLQKDNGRWSALSGQLIRHSGSQELVPPKKVKDVSPDYPSRAEKERIQGTVVLEGTVTLEGKVADIEVIRSIPELDQAAIDAVEKWVYEPAAVDGVPTPMVTMITVNFLLE